MGRPKGSKNVTRGTKKLTDDEWMDKVTDAAPPITEKEVKKIKEFNQVGHSIVFDPKPDMGNIKPPPTGKQECNCSHEQEFHYGGARGHCNRPGCGCMEFR